LENRILYRLDQDSDEDEDFPINTEQPPDNDDTSNPSSPKFHFKTMARLYEQMCEQNVDDGSFHRREMQYLSANQCVERLAMLETRACALKLREEEIQNKSRELKLIDNRQVCTMMGYRIPLENMTTPPTQPSNHGN
jgi:hypothetical protein